MNLGLTWASSLMRWCVPGCLDRGRNLDFLGIQVLADVKNGELPCQFLRCASPYFSVSRHLIRHGFFSHARIHREPQGQTMCVAKCCARQTCTHQIEASWEAEKPAFNAASRQSKLPRYRISLDAVREFETAHAACPAGPQKTEQPRRKKRSDTAAVHHYF